MSHRGATGSHEHDGDGAGIMTSMPHDFLTKAFHTLGINAPMEHGHYAVGNVFMSTDSNERQQAQKRFEATVHDAGLTVAGWRRAPVFSECLGPVSAGGEPWVMQPLVVCSGAWVGDVEMHRMLFLIKKRIRPVVGYLCSLDTKTLVYKGLFCPWQLFEYYADLKDYTYSTHFALVHSRFSTNTFPSWERAQPFSLCAHNGEINTLRGNKNWMRAREGLLKSDLFEDDLQSVFPIIDESGSDSAAFNNVLELLTASQAFSLPEALMVMVPEAWQNDAHMSAAKRSFYEWASCIMEPWDGPALFAFSDGRYCGAQLDRNGLRPCRYYITRDAQMICASEVGVVNVAPEKVVQRGRLIPGRMLLVDTQLGIVVDDELMKENIAGMRPFSQWIEQQQIRLEHFESTSDDILIDDIPLSADCRMAAFGYSAEQLDMILGPMALHGKEPLGSMGNDAVLACLDTRVVRLPYEYMRQLFAQVTNPPIDPIREKLIMSLRCHVGPERNLLQISEHQAHRLSLDSPLLTLPQLAAIRRMAATKYPSWTTKTIDITFDAALGIDGYVAALDRACAESTEAVEDGCRVIVLSDRLVDDKRAAVSALLALGAVHHHLVAQRQRARVALMVETGEARETHHFCVLLGYGADAICPYMAYEVLAKLHRENVLQDHSIGELVARFQHAVDDGVRKVMSKMGISTLQSYKGAQIFEALGVAAGVVDRCFRGTASRIGGTDMRGFAMAALVRHHRAYGHHVLGDEGEYAWRAGGQHHVNMPQTISSLQDAVRRQNADAWRQYTDAAERAMEQSTLRGRLELHGGQAIDVSEVEPWTAIVRRFCTGAMSYGSISMEAHAALGVAMNRLGGKSNSGEGGEDAGRSQPLANGDCARSAIKQVASGRFGVTSRYLADADELQIKMAQGAKPGEGGELLGTKVSAAIARTRHTTPGVTLVSPPPHHDIYSIEDLKQLIFDLKSANPRARVSVKLVSESGVGVVAAGVAKALADHILVAGHDGGTGAARWTGIKYAGLPWELGLAETHQTLVLNALRGRVVLQADGQLKTARDVAVAALLGAEEFGFATAPLVALGCVYLRRCHQNSCAVGVATQDPVLRSKFAGLPEHVVHFFQYLAEDLRVLMAALGFRTVAEMVGRSEHLRERAGATPVGIDLSALLRPAHSMRPGAATRFERAQDHGIKQRMDARLVPQLLQALQTGKRMDVSTDVHNTDRAVGTLLSYHVSCTKGAEGLAEGSVRLRLRGSAGQSLGAFLAPGIAIDLEGDANDYVGKGLSGGRLAVYPQRASSDVDNNVIDLDGAATSNNVIVGNVCLFGATSGEAFICGLAAERFAVRNSGALAVVEGVGDHGCEYMTGGRVVVLGNVGRNFAAGMSGGIAYVLASNLHKMCNVESVGLVAVQGGEEARWLRRTVERHAELTGSIKARNVIERFDELLPKFTKVYPHEYRRVLEAEAEKEKETETQAEIILPPALADTVTSLVDIEDAMVDDSQLAKRVQRLDKLRGFAKYRRRTDAYRPAHARTKDWQEISARQTKAQLQVQASRCIDCGIPFCQSSSDGCPLGNVVPKWNDLVFRDRWHDAFLRLMATNNFPEFTGRVCPAPCEGACVAGISEKPVAIKAIEAAIIDHAWEMGWMQPRPPPLRTGRSVAVVGSGPAGLAAAEQLNSAGHLVTVYEREDRIGGLLIYGIPNMKLDKQLVARRVDKMRDEGIVFVTGAHIGATGRPAADLLQSADAVLLATGATWPRDLAIPGRQLEGIHYAMDFLTTSTKRLLDGQPGALSAEGCRVVVIGGGDTGNDCIGTAVRQGARSVVNFELMPKPPTERAVDNPWPQYPRTFRIDYGHEEVVAHWGNDPRQYCISTKRFIGSSSSGGDSNSGRVTGIETVRVEWTKGDSGWTMQEVAGSEEVFEADLVFLAMGFLGPENAVLDELCVERMPRSNVKTAEGSYATSVPRVFAAGDCRRGQSLVVWAINEGRQAAREVDQMLQRECGQQMAVGFSNLPVSGGVLCLEHFEPILEAEVEVKV
ncbi:glutamate synthase [NADH] [Kickxella alabastrina]|uniref:Glutamate synthase [NADH] n=1 Tax=Kickxella alabastrina TaxID=61397 RepID=A0ACC1IFS1_9FUNG|nr:glutamate synthase [NADH] [Kickxella alabastrina]